MSDANPSTPNNERLGLSGRIAKSFLTTEITPLLALVGLLLGIFAVIITPREEEPQIDVTFANVFIPFPGASAKEVESLVTTPAEQIVSEIKGVKHVYSVSSPGMATLTVRYKIGEDRTAAIVRLYNAFYSKGAWVPANSGVGQVLIKPKGIDDVPIVTGTLWSRDHSLTNAELLSIARTLQTELQRVPGTREINIVGGENREVKVLFDPQKLAAYQLSLSDLRNTLGVANTSIAAGNVLQDSQEVLVQAGQFLIKPEEVADLVVSVVNGAPIFLRDVADVSFSEASPSQYVMHGVGPSSDLDIRGRYPAITLAVAKKAGENAVDVADNVIQRFEQLRGIYFPDNVDASITRNYGATAEDKAQTLIKKLIFATVSVIVLVIFALGRRESIVVGAAVIVTLAITLFASWAWGFTLNRVSLFALIFSIGILVDDAIVVVENIHRHLTLGNLPLKQAIPKAVDEVGSPTILATFTVIAALLPMAFVTGLMGPYMSPIPINASSGMLISLAVAFVFTPWLYRRLFEGVQHHHNLDSSPASHDDHGRFHKLFSTVMTPFLRQQQGRSARVMLLITILVLISLSVGLAVMEKVVLKMLPFDNKSEFQVVLDMPEGTALETTQMVLQALADKIDTVPEVTDYQLYAGTAAPINFNGLVRQYYLRSESNMGDIQVNLLDKHLRDRKSHEIALATRKLLAPVAQQYGANVKVVEVPPGPPVMSPLVAEVYGLDYHKQVEVAKAVQQTFLETPDIVDVDSTIEASQQKWNVVVDRARAAYFGVNQATITQAINTAINGENVSYLHDENAKVAIPVRLELPSGDKSRVEAITGLKVRASNGALIPLSEVVHIQKTTRDQSIYHKDMLPVVYVMGDSAGKLDSPLYGLGQIYMALQDKPIDGQILDQSLYSQPENPYRWSLKWDGELQVTLDTFRDMGIAYSVGLIMIYLLVVGMFKSYSVPLIIMAPIPLTIIGIMPGHALLGQQFTAPSMIGMIALAGIIVRNSILLVDFIQQEVRSGKSLEAATINAASVRALPIMLTAVAAMMGGFFIIDDPIFGGLAVSLIFGLLVSTVLTLLVIPVVYYAYQYKKHMR